MSQLDFIANQLPNGTSTIITGVDKNNKEVFFVIANKNNRRYIKEVASKEEGRKYITDLFEGESTFCGKFSRK